ncbi:MAG: DUF58 domain-containing protein [Myxococcota bacterium]
MNGKAPRAATPGAAPGSSVGRGAKVAPRGRTAPADRQAQRELLERIRKIEIVTTRKVNDQLAGQYHSVFKGRGMSFDEVRPYQPGDEIRFIDWNVTARSTEPFVKRFVEERELTVMLLVDASASLAFGANAQLKREVAAELSALLAFSAVKNNDRVGMVMFTDGIEHFVPPKKGKKHVLRLVSDVLGFQPAGRGTDISECLRYLSRVSSRKTITFLISDFQAPTKSFEHALRVVARRHDIVPVIIRDQMESELPDLGLVLVEDLETGADVWVDTSSRRVRERFKQNAEGERKALTDLFRKMKIDGIQVETGGSYVKALVQFFELRARRL